MAVVHPTEPWHVWKREEFLRSIGKLGQLRVKESLFECGRRSWIFGTDIELERYTAYMKRLTYGIESPL